MDQNRTFGWLVLGLDPTVECKNGRGIIRHTVIRPGSEMEELDSQYTTVPIQLETGGKRGDKAVVYKYTLTEASNVLTV